MPQATYILILQGLLRNILGKTLSPRPAFLCTSAYSVKSYNAVVFNEAQFWPRQMFSNVWERLRFSQLGACRWNLMGRGQRCC